MEDRPLQTSTDNLPGALAPAGERARVLLAGIGNIFLGDDAFGVEVAQALLRRPQQAGVRVVDFGIRALDLTYALIDGCDAAILIDAAPRGEAPGTLFVIEPDLGADAPGAGAPPGGAMLDTHNMDPVKVLRAAWAMGAQARRVLVVGCEPTPPDPNLDPAFDMQMGMSPPVQAAVEEAVRLVESLAGRLLADPSAAIAGPASTLQSSERSYPLCPS